MHGKHVNGGQEAGIGFVENSTLFDFRRQALLVIPEGLPDPSARDFAEKAAEHVRQSGIGESQLQRIELFAR
jgi:hypothetical protein